MDFKKRIIEELKLTTFQADTLYSGYIAMTEKLAIEYHNEQLRLLSVVKSVKEKETLSFQKWANTKGYYQIGIEWFSDCGYPRQYNELIKMYQDEHQL